jgi:UDP-N-acetylmuramyl pentapeptide phosphotransferase/UDP-N-acetylglucosamine-1-phosphate transferase
MHKAVVFFNLGGFWECWKNPNFEHLPASDDLFWLIMMISFAMIGWCDDWLGAKDPIPKKHFNALLNIILMSAVLSQLN